MENITKSELEVMRIVWTLHDPTANKIIKIMDSKRNWSSSTTKTLIKRLVIKHFLIHDGKVRNRKYLAEISESDLLEAELSQTLNEICAKCRGKVLLNVLKNFDLSKQDWQNLADLALARKPSAPIEIACNCLNKENYGS